MRISVLSVFAPLAMTFLVVVAPVTSAQDRPPSTAKLPKAVLTAFEKAYPNAKVLTSTSENENGKTLYEIESLDEGRRRDLLYLADGTVWACEETIDPTTLPAPVKIAIDHQYEGWKIEKAEKATLGKSEAYELVLSKGKERTSLVLAPDGTVRKTGKQTKQNIEKAAPNKPRK